MSNIVQLKSLMQSIEKGVDQLLAEIAEQKKEIANLQNNYKIATKQIEGYVTELEQIRNHYVNSNNNAK
jgi:hypothetical protein